jgi:hypothetical protein
MATTNAYSDVYISDLSGANAVYMDISPISTPFIPPPQGKQVSTPCLPGLDDDGNITAGQVIHWDAGGHISDTIVTWKCSKCLEATYQSLLTKYKSIADVVFSLDDGTTAYQAQFVKPGGLNVTLDSGRKTYNLEIQLKIIALIV